MVLCVLAFLVVAIGGVHIDQHRLPIRGLVQGLRGARSVGVLGSKLLVEFRFLFRTLRLALPIAAKLVVEQRIGREVGLARMRIELDDLFSCHPRPSGRADTTRALLQTAAKMHQPSESAKECRLTATLPRQPGASLETSPPVGDRAGVQFEQRSQGHEGRMQGTPDLPRRPSESGRHSAWSQ